MTDLDSLINLIVSDAQLATGEDAFWLQQNAGVVRSGSRGAGVKHGSNRKYPVWTTEEDDFIRANIGRMGILGVADALGRGENAVKIHIIRKGLPHPSRVPGWLTANQVANLLGHDSHKICRWIDEGMMPGEHCAWSIRTIRRVRIYELKAWLIRPETWIYIDAKKITQPGLRRLVQLAQARWGDEWWSMRQAADYSGTTPSDLHRQIHIGRLKGIQSKNLGGRDQATWSFWYARRSDVVRLVIPKGKGSGHQVYNWSPKADAFLLKARAAGKSYVEIGKMMNWPAKRVTYRAFLLSQKVVGK